MEENNFRERTCNFCDFSTRCGIPDGVVCSEEHHQEGKDKFKYYERKGCEYFKDELNNDAYGLIEIYKKDKVKRISTLESSIASIKEEIEDKQKMLFILENMLKREYED